MDTAEPSERVSARTWAAACVLAVAGLFCAADFYLPQLLVDPIRAAFHLTDVQIAWLTGASFGISMSVFGLPLSWAADRYNRAGISSPFALRWCLMTVGSGFTTGFWSLFVLRLGVGNGEAALKPTAYSLMADLFPVKALPTRARGFRGRLHAGQRAGPVRRRRALRRAPACGARAQRFRFAEGDAWRWTNRGAGRVGLLVALAAASLLRDPRRRSVTPVPAQTGDGLSFPSFLRASMSLLHSVYPRQRRLCDVAGGVDLGDAILPAHLRLDHRPGRPGRRRHEPRHRTARRAARHLDERVDAQAARAGGAGGGDLDRTLGDHAVPGAGTLGAEWVDGARRLLGHVPRRQRRDRGDPDCLHHHRAAAPPRV